VASDGVFWAGFWAELSEFVKKTTNQSTP